jgi:hypothetical protein
VSCGNEPDYGSLCNSFDNIFFRLWTADRGLLVTLWLRALLKARV